MGLLARYMSGLCVGVLGLCAAGWLALTPVAFGYLGPRLHDATLADRATAGGLAVVSLLTLAMWILAWRRKLQADGALPTRTSRRQTPDPAQVLSELRALLLPLLAEPSAPPEPPEAPAEAPAEVHHGVPPPRHEQKPSGAFGNYPLPPSPAPSGIAAIESILAGGDLLMVGSGEEEAW